MVQAKLLDYFNFRGARARPFRIAPLLCANSSSSHQNLNSSLGYASIPLIDYPTLGAPPQNPRHSLTISGGKGMKLLVPSNRTLPISQVSLGVPTLSVSFVGREGVF
jgi:hypothetical protein